MTMKRIDWLRAELTYERDAVNHCWPNCGVNHPHRIKAAEARVEVALREWWAQDCKEVDPSPPRWLTPLSVFPTPTQAGVGFVTAVRDALIAFESANLVTAPAVPELPWRPSVILAQAVGTALSGARLDSIKGDLRGSSKACQAIEAAYCVYDAAPEIPFDQLPKDDKEAARRLLDQLTGGALTSLLASVNDDCLPLLGGEGWPKGAAHIHNNLKANLRALGYIE